MSRSVSASRLRAAYARPLPYHPPSTRDEHTCCDPDARCYALACLERAAARDGDLRAVADLCACGFDRGDHDAIAPHACEDSECPRFTARQPALWPENARSAAE